MKSRFDFLKRRFIFLKQRIAKIFLDFRKIKRAFVRMKSRLTPVVCQIVFFISCFRYADSKSYYILFLFQSAQPLFGYLCLLTFLTRNFDIYFQSLVQPIQSLVLISLKVICHTYVIVSRCQVSTFRI